MRPVPGLALVFLAVALHAETFPAPLGSERAVSAVEPIGTITAGTTQRVTGIASGANGYAVFWAERIAENVAHSYVRRFSENGTPQDATPIHVADGFSTTSLTEQATIVSNGETYLLAWRTIGNVDL